MLICCLQNVCTRVVTFITCCETKFQGQLVVLWQGNGLSLMNIPLELWTSLNCTKKYCGKQVLGSEEKNPDVAVLPAGPFWAYEKHIKVSTRESPILPDLNNIRRQFNSGPFNPRIRHHYLKARNNLKQTTDVQGIPVCKTAPASTC